MTEIGAQALDLIGGQVKTDQGSEGAEARRDVLQLWVKGGGDRRERERESAVESE